jgi:hypothetical protein
MCCAQDNIVGRLAVRPIVRRRIPTRSVSVHRARHAASHRIESRRRCTSRDFDGLKKNTRMPSQVITFAEQTEQL